MTATTSKLVINRVLNIFTVPVARKKTKWNAECSIELT